MGKEGYDQPDRSEESNDICGGTGAVEADWLYPGDFIRY